ncbi:hypothetical protein BDV95DRAFT_508055 [Massariosphaeria phaeospora]|uniref:Uncharacterized protein n=1 Tax=Massariosphaeria phaeospora TaxID=100035 RepID=A0A7C8LZV5_9PLEO|nr:hypothetical protein BDV95DRAFT_508055 [Massariosphaeria phaeospora]
MDEYPEYPLTPEEERALEDEHFLQPSCNLHERTVSTALLTSTASFIEPPSIGSPPTSTFELPRSPESAAALEFIGFTPAVAVDIYNRCFAQSPQDRDMNTFDRMYRGPVSYLNALPRDMAPTETMQIIGLKPEVIEALNDPEFADVRGTQSLHYWVRDTLDISYAALIDLTRRLKHVATLALVRKWSRDLQTEIVLESGSFATGQGPRTGTPTATISLPSDVEGLPANAVTVQAAGPELPDHDILWMGRAAGHVKKRPFIAEDGSVLMRALCNDPHNDFNTGSVALYLSPERSTAERYRLWAASRCPYSETWAIRIQIPRTFTQGLRQEHIWYSAEWKEYVWYCHTGGWGSGSEVRSRFAKFEAAELLVGHVGRPGGSFAHVKRLEDVQSQITHDHLLDPSSRATQWVFKHEAAERLAMLLRGQGKIHIDIFPPRVLAS